MQSTALSLKQWNKLCGDNIICGGATNMPFTRQCPHRSYRNNQADYRQFISINGFIDSTPHLSHNRSSRYLGGISFGLNQKSQYESPTIKCNKNLTFLLLAAIHLAATVRSLAGETHLPIFHIKSWRKIRKNQKKRVQQCRISAESVLNQHS